MIKSTILPGYHKAINGRDIIYTDHINLAAVRAEIGNALEKKINLG